MKNQVLSLLCGVSFLVSSPVFAMEPEKTESKSIVSRTKFTVNKPSPLQEYPLEWLFHEGVFDSTRIQPISRVDCIQLLMTSKTLYNWFVPYRQSFALGVRLDDTSFNGTGSLLIETSKHPSLSLADCRLSLCFSTQATIDNERLPMQLCSFRFPSKFGQVAYCLSKAYQPISYFPALHGEPKQFFLKGVPEQWQSSNLALEEIQCGSKLDLSRLPGNKFKLMLEVVNQEETRYRIHNNLFMIKEDMPSEVQKLEDTTPMVKKETKEEGFARLRPQIIEMIDAAKDREEIASALRIPQDLIDEILHSQPIVKIEEEASEDENESIRIHTLNIFEDVADKLSKIFDNFPDEDLIDETNDSQQMLMVGDEFYEDDTSLFSQIIQLKNEAWDNEEIALYLRISEDEVDEVLNSQRANQ